MIIDKPQSQVIYLPTFRNLGKKLLSLSNIQIKHRASHDLLVLESRPLTVTQTSSLAMKANSLKRLVRAKK